MSARAGAVAAPRPWLGWAFLPLLLTVCGGGRNNPVEAEPEAPLPDAAGRRDAAEQPGTTGDAHLNGDPASGKLGDIQCALYRAGGCQQGCTAIQGRALDRTRRCLMPRSVVDCSSRTVFPEEVVCRVNLASGVVHRIPVLALDAPEFLGWRPCTDSEGALLDESAAQDCP